MQTKIKRFILSTNARIALASMSTRWGLPQQDIAGAAVVVMTRKPQAEWSEWKAEAEKIHAAYKGPNDPA